MDRHDGSDIDPADQWVLDPETGSYRLRLDTDTPPAPTVPRQGGRRARREEQRPVPEPGGRRRAGAPASRKAKRSTKRKVLMWTAGTLGFVLLAGSTGAYFLYRHLDGNIATVDVGTAGSKQATSKDAVNILVIGTDSRQGLGGKYGDAGSVGHADTTILFHVAKDRSNATAMSIPRDMVTGIPDCPTKQKDGSTKTIPATPQGSFGPRFNESLGQEGRDPGCTMRTVTKITGIPVDHFVLVNFEAVKTLSTAVGGVPICLTHPIKDTTPEGEGSHLDLPAGPSKVQGEQALAFVRTRHSLKNGSDLDRIDLQKQFLGSMIRQMKSGDTLTDPTKLFKLANAATKSLTVDTGIGGVAKLTDLAKDLSRVDPEHITFTTLPVKDNPAEGTKHATVVVDETKAPALFKAIKSDVSLTKAKKKKPATADSKLRGAKADPSQVRVLIHNGGGPQGAAQDTLEWLQNTKGVTHSTNGGNAPGGKQDRTTLEYAPDQADQARALAAMMGLPAAALRPGTADAEAGANMTLTLGGDYQGPGTPLADPDRLPDDIPQSRADKEECVG
ncbi:LCP family protein [Actinacidiphila glaucinigra]|uniref:Transcriptional attenuator, LytR family n=1 Tax=Actinacidiphila glaucinigra TaxID=235986 RepID=A0A239M6J5_9ACTN|nr:LCP family protein [Actinacidiphila glaucinigra]SNT38527.1 transcriptional attenuator, LytR family [Actinacidiphila glaucinigra]